MADKGVIMRCVIIAGSPDTNSDFLSEVIKPDDYVICADRGCNFAKQAVLHCLPSFSLIEILYKNIVLCKQRSMQNPVFRA